MCGFSKELDEVMTATWTDIVGQSCHVFDRNSLFQVFLYCRTCPTMASSFRVLGSSKFLLPKFVTNIKDGGGDTAEYRRFFTKFIFSIFCVEITKNFILPETFKDVWLFEHGWLSSWERRCTGVSKSF